VESDQETVKRAFIGNSKVQKAPKSSKIGSVPVVSMTAVARTKLSFM